MLKDDSKKQLEIVVEYMRSHWPSDVKEEWQVKLKEYPEILEKIVSDFTLNKTKNKNLIRIAGLSGSGKTSQILPAVEKYCEAKKIEPVLIAARRFVEYHPHYVEIKEYYGEEKLRQKTDEFSTIMMFLSLNALTKMGYDIILDVTLLDPKIEKILLGMLKNGDYKTLLLMIATSPIVTEYFLGGRSWRHSEKTEKEFIRATFEALEFYAKNFPELKTIFWSVYDLEPIYDGPVKDGLEIFKRYSQKTDLPLKNDEERKKAKIDFMLALAQNTDN